MSSKVDKETDRKNMEPIFKIDDIEVNPIEILFFTSRWDGELKTEDILKKEKSENRERTIKCFSLKEIGLVGCSETLVSYSSLKNGVYVLNEKAKTFLLLWLALFYTEVPTWFSKNVIEYELGKLGTDCESLLYQKVNEFIEENGLHITVNCIVSRERLDCLPFSKMQKNVVLMKQVKMRTSRKLVLKHLALKGILHRRFGQRKYIKYLNDNMVYKDKYTLLKQDIASSTSSTFIKICEDGEDIFLKGNEVSIYHSIQNEIKAQKCLNAHYSGENWYLPMVGCALDAKWIKYPFVHWKSLDVYFADKRLSMQEIEKLGLFLTECVKKLKTVGISHNDLHPGNILVCESEEGLVKRYTLIDFGCSSIFEESPWDVNYWGRYMADNVCGGYRYSGTIVDDAASAYLIYLEYGGKRTDSIAVELKNLFGKGGVYLNSDL